MTLDSLRALREAATYPTRPPGKVTEQWRNDARKADIANDQLARLAPCLVDALIEAHEALLGLREYAWATEDIPERMIQLIDAAIARIDTLDKDTA